MVTAENLEIFILTYNRVATLPFAIKSVLEQSVKGFSICVFDNGSSDGTANAVKAFADDGVKYIRNETNNHLRVFDQIKEISSRSWVMIFHDDDLMHKNYIANGLAMINMYPSISLVCSGMEQSYEPTTKGWDMKENKSHFYCATSGDFASLLFRDYPIPFCSVIYKTSTFKILDVKSHLYGKIYDRPLIIDASRNGGAVVLKDAYIRSGIHAFQDSKSSSTGPYANEMIALDKYYFNVLGENLFTRNGRVFVARNYFRLSRWFEWIGMEKSGLTKRQFIQLAQKQVAFSDFGMRIGIVYEIIFGFPYRLKRRLISMMRRFPFFKSNS